MISLLHDVTSPLLAQLFATARTNATWVLYTPCALFLLLYIRGVTRR